MAAPYTRPKILQVIKSIRDDAEVIRSKLVAYQGARFERTQGSLQFLANTGQPLFDITDLDAVAMGFADANDAVTHLNNLLDQADITGPILGLMDALDRCANSGIRPGGFER